MTASRKSQYIPDRGHIIWIDFDPAKGKEIGKYRPALVLSDKSYNKKTGLIICSPISTSIRGYKSEVPVKGMDKPSVVVSGIVKTVSWENRHAKFIQKADRMVFEKTVFNIATLIGIGAMLQNLDEHIKEKN